MTSIFFIAKEDIHEAHPSVCERMGRSESGKSALQRVYFAGWSFVFEVRSVSTTRRTAN
jgi:hypothetical protein